MVYLNRKEVLEEVRSKVKAGKSCVLTGEEGIGKSFLLKQFKEFLFCSLPVKKMLENITGRKESINELMELAVNPAVVVFDDYGLLNKNGRKIITELQRKGFVFITSSLKEIPDFETVKLERLTFEEAFEGFKESGIPEDKFRQIYEKSGGLAHYLNKYCMEFRKGGDEFRQISFKKINLLSSKSFLSLATLLIAVRYYLYLSKDFKTGYIFAFAAYLLYFVFRRFK